MRGYFAWDDINLDDELSVEFAYTRKYMELSGADISERELECLRIMLPACACGIQEGDMFVGRRVFRPLGIAPSYWDDDWNGLDNVSYYADTARLGRVMERPSQSPEMRRKIAELIEFWKSENVNAKVRAAFDDTMKREMPSDMWSRDSGVVFGLYRFVSSQLDYDKLVRLGLPGLRQEISARLSRGGINAEQQRFLGALDGLIGILTGILKNYAAELEAMPQDENISAMLSCVKRLAVSAPQSFRDALQLVWLYSALAGGRDFGRMDVYLGDLYARDIDSGILTQAQAEELLVSFYRMMDDTDSRDGRIIIGGVGRRNEANADRVSLTILGAGMTYRGLKPEFSLRMYKGLDPKVREKALEMLGDGMTFPLLFNDEASVASVQQTMNVDITEAEQYGFFGCGEYVLGHRSMGTPNDIINLAKALEVTLHRGTDPVRGCAHGLDLGDPKDFDTFEKLFDAYKAQVEYFTDIASKHHRLVYDTVARSGAMLQMSLLMDDCVERALPMVSGGIRYLAGTYETYGNITVSDSLTAVNELVYEKKLLTLSRLTEILDADFEGHEELRAKLLACPKFGNGDEKADSMAKRVNDHIFACTAAQAEKRGLSSYLVVMINNGANVDLGKTTLATADGRHAYTYLSNGNNPMAGMDKNGPLALLRSEASTSMCRTAGTAQNLKLSKKLFREHIGVVNRLIDSAFEMGILSLNISVMDKGELEDAMVHPGKYPNLFVRVGGFSARFVTLDRGTQTDVLNRVLY